MLGHIDKTGPIPEEEGTVDYTLLAPVCEHQEKVSLNILPSALSKKLRAGACTGASPQAVRTFLNKLRLTPVPQSLSPIFTSNYKYYAGDPKIPLNTPGYKNGNITAMYWQVKSGSVEKPGGGEKFGGHKMAYEFKYDKLDRLKSARFAHIYQEQGQEVYVNNDAYGVPSIGYDKIGNITALWRKRPWFDCEQYGGEIPPGSGYIDKMTYTYNTDKSLLTGISDAGTADGFTYSSSYAYDSNGNLESDGGKMMDIGYNHLNLPGHIDKTGPTPQETDVFQFFRMYEKTAANPDIIM